MNCNIYIQNINITEISEEQLQKIYNTLNMYGVAVLEDVFTGEEVTNYFNDSVKWMENINPELAKGEKFWTEKNLPYGPRLGMYHSIVSHSPVAWTLREKLYPLFKSLWGTDDLITSLDGATILPPNKPRHIKSVDWPHIDQTSSFKNKQAIQGQVVCTTTSSTFRCTPTSNLIHEELRTKYNFLSSKTEWFKFNKEQINELSIRFGDLWQIPISVKAGSIILWYSTTIHSSIDPVFGEKEWRCVYYICQRPKNHFSKRNLKTISDSALNGRTTNHWGTNMFPKYGRYDKQNKSENVMKILEHPEKYKPLKLTPIQLKLVGLQ